MEVPLLIPVGGLLIRCIANARETVVELDGWSDINFKACESGVIIITKIAVRKTKAEMTRPRL